MIEMKKALLSIAAIILMSCAAYSENEVKPEPSKQERAGIISTLPQAAFLKEPETVKLSVESRMDLVASYLGSHKKPGAGETRGVFEEHKFSEKASLVYAGVLWYNQNDGVGRIVDNYKDMKDAGKEEARQFVVDNLISLHDGLIEDLGVSLEAVNFISDFAGYVEKMKFEEEDISKLKKLASESDTSLGTFLSEEFGAPAKGYAQFGYVLSDMYSALEIYKAKNDQGMDKDTRQKIYEYIAGELPDITKYSDQIKNDRNIVNAVKRAMAKLEKVTVVDDNTIADVQDNMDTIVIALMNGTFEKKDSDG